MSSISHRLIFKSILIKKKTKMRDMYAENIPKLITFLRKPNSVYINQFRNFPPPENISFFIKKILNTLGQFCKE